MMTKKKIAIVGHTYWEANNRQKIWALSQQSGAEIRLYIPDFWIGSMRAPTTFKPSPWDEGFQIVALPVVKPGKFYDYTLSGLEKELRSFKPDLIHLEAEPPTKIFAQVISLSDFKCKLTFFTWENFVEDHGFWGNRRERAALRRSDGAVAGNSDAQNILRKKNFDKPITIIPQLGINCEQFIPKDVTELKKSHGLKGIVVGYLGRFTRYKGLLVLLEAFKQLRGEATLFLVGGGGELSADLPGIVAEMGLSDSVKIHGPIPAEMSPDYLNCFDLLVLPSLTAPRWKEQFGHVLIEAMACDVPLVGSDSGAIPEVIGDAGLVAPEGDVQKLAEHLQTLIDDPTQRKLLRDKGLERVKNFTHKHLAKQIIKFWNKILNC